MKRYLTPLLIIITSICLVACDFDKPENENYLYNNEATSKRVKINIEEAKVLSDVAILNETVISISQLSQIKSNEYHVKKISSKLKKDNLKIKRQLSDLAEKKIILLPNSIDETVINELLKIEENSFSETYLKKVKLILESEVAQLKYLSNITNDVDFKVLTVKLLVTLQYNLNQIQNILKTNY
ncbi:DUF4142 domain-containing protein [Mariniflexile jejuense]|uniref:DUF4142 domain-containing protein n=1 Tax=Mariniflexile jejuense TaxID=1173582 RepID=A0ABW3JQF3_9FLAO